MEARLFLDRHDAGRQLATALMHLKASKPVILALPRGGVPVAYEIACMFHAPLDLVLVQKIGAPFSSELALGAVVDGNPPHHVLNDAVLQMVKPSETYLKAEIERQIKEIERRRQLYRSGRPPIAVDGRTVIVVDDGIATGSTMKAALQAFATEDPEQLIFAVPVAPPETLESLRDEADEGVCLRAPENFRAVSLFYEDFRQTSDEEVISLLAAAASSAR